MKPNFYELINKVKPLLFVPLLLFLFLKSFAAGELFPVGSRSAAMGRCSVALKGFWGIQNNQAAMALVDKYSFGLNYESRFLIEETSYKNIGILAPTRFGTLGLSVNYYGYSAYNELKAGLAYARSFGKILRFGLQLDYFSTHLGDNYGSRNDIAFELGVQSDLTEKLTLGAYIFNPVNIKLKSNIHEDLGSIIRFGLAYSIDSPLLISFEAEKNSFINPVLFRFGLEYSIKSKFFLRAGIASRYEIFTFGFGMVFEHIRINLAACMHEYLGFSPQLGFIVNL
jgi:hypothetical protein